MVPGIFSGPGCIVYHGTMSALFHYRHRNSYSNFLFRDKHLLFGVPGAKCRLSALCVV